MKKIHFFLPRIIFCQKVFDEELHKCADNQFKSQKGGNSDILLMNFQRGSDMESLVKIIYLK